MKKLGLGVMNQLAFTTAILLLIVMGFYDVLGSYGVPV